MENPEEILHSLEEFSKQHTHFPRDIPRELEDYLGFVAKTGDPVYPWAMIKTLVREKMLSVIQEFYESCNSAVDIPPCPNVDVFNYAAMKTFILDRLETFAATPFTVQRICELLTTPHKEYNRIDKYMRALEKNVLVVSTVEAGLRRSNPAPPDLFPPSHQSMSNNNNIVNGLIVMGELNHPISDMTVDVEVEEDRGAEPPLPVTGTVWGDGNRLTSEVVAEEDENKNENIISAEKGEVKKEEDLTVVVEGGANEREECTSEAMGTSTSTDTDRGRLSEDGNCNLVTDSSTTDAATSTTTTLLQKLPPIETITCSTSKHHLAAAPPPPPPSTAAVVIGVDEISSSFVVGEEVGGADSSSSSSSSTTGLVGEDEEIENEAAVGVDEEEVEVAVDTTGIKMEEEAMSEQAPLAEGAEPEEEQDQQISSAITTTTTTAIGSPEPDCGSRSDNVGVAEPIEIEPLEAEVSKTCVVVTADAGTDILADSSEENL